MCPHPNCNILWIVCKPWCKRAAAKLGANQLSVKLCTGQETLSINHPALVPANPRQYGGSLPCFRRRERLYQFWELVPLHAQCAHGATYHRRDTEGSLQALKRLYDEADSSGESESVILHILELFRPLASDIIVEADHHATRCREPEKSVTISWYLNCPTSSLP